MRFFCFYIFVKIEIKERMIKSRAQMIEDYECLLIIYFKMIEIY